MDRIPNFINDSSQTTDNRPSDSPNNEDYITAKTVSIFINGNLSRNLSIDFRNSNELTNQVQGKILKNKKLKTKLEVYFSNVKKSNLPAIIETIFKFSNAECLKKYENLDTKYKINSLLSTKNFGKALEKYTHIADESLEQFWKDSKISNQNCITAKEIREWLANEDHAKSLENIKYLILAGSMMGLFPKEIVKFKNLTILYLQDSDLIDLPKEIGEFKNLTKLCLDYNNLTTLPKEIGKLEKLEELVLRGNNLTTIPKEIGNLKKLSKLDLRENNDLTITKDQIEKLFEFDQYVTVIV